MGLGEATGTERKRRGRRLATGAVVAMVAFVLLWGVFVGSHTDIAPVTTPFSGSAAAIATNFGCPVVSGQSPDVIVISKGDAWLAAKGARVTTTQTPRGDTETTAHYDQLPAGGALRVTRRWFRSTSYLYLAPDGAQIPLYRAPGVASVCP
jgi:hypothetical protein